MSQAAGWCGWVVIVGIATAAPALRAVVIVLFGLPPALTTSGAVIVVPARIVGPRPISRPGDQDEGKQSNQ